MAAEFDITNVRARFPGLNQPIVLLDNAGGSQVLDTVIESIHDYLSKTNVQLAATYPVSQTSTKLFEEGYKAAAQFINASPDEITIGISSTQLLHNLSTAFDFKPGDEIIISNLNHEANSAAWVRIAEHMSLTLKIWSGESTNPDCDVESLKPLLSENTRIVACPHASNITGTITRVKEIADLVHSYPKALFCVDGVALAPHRQVDVKALDVDFYVFSWYKVYGPHIAQLYAASRVHPQINSLAHYFKADQRQTLDTKLNLASASYDLVPSLPMIANQYFKAHEPSRASQMWNEIAEHEERLQTILLEFLGKKAKSGIVTIYGEPQAKKELRVPVISFTVKGMTSRRVVDEVEKISKLGFRHGHMYSHRLLKDVFRFEDVEDGVVRISMLHYNTEAEMHEVVRVLEKIIPDN